MRALDFQRDLKDFLREYQYQPHLTKRLDQLGEGPFSQELVNEIVLWKLNRCVPLNSSALQALETLRGLKTGEHRQGEAVLRLLLGSHGVDLPMASTIMRFRNAETFQIIDRHAYRAIYDHDYPLYQTTSHERKVGVYFQYLDELVDLCRKRDLAFATIDRLLYIFDKRTNGKLSKRGASEKA